MPKDGIYYTGEITEFTPDMVNLYKQLSSSTIQIKDSANIIDSPNHIIIGCYVIERHGTDYKTILAGLSTLYLEKKLIHNGQYLGHIEDVVVDHEYRKKGAAKGMIRELIKQATANNCYKVILSCDPALSNLYKNVFDEYELKQKEEVSLSLYLNG